jgi:hypothetical protein
MIAQTAIHIIGNFGKLQGAIVLKMYWQPEPLTICVCRNLLTGITLTAIPINTPKVFQLF